MSVSYAGKPDIDADIFKSIMCLLHFLETITFQKLKKKPGVTASTWNFTVSRQVPL